MKHTVLIIFIAALFYSCSKSDQPQTPVEGTFVGSNTMDYQTVRMFTLNGEVKDSHIIADFVSHKELENTFQKPGIVTQDVRLSVVVNADQSVEANDGVDIVKGTLSSYGGNILKITGQAKDDVLIAPGTDCANRIYSINLMLFNHFGGCGTIGVSNGYSQVCKYLPGFFLVVEAPKRIYVPSQSYYLSNYTSINDTRNVCSYSATNDLNLVNPDHYKSLRANDTLVVQERRLVLLKK